MSFFNPNFPECWIGLNRKIKTSKPVIVVEFNLNILESFGLNIFKEISVEVTHACFPVYLYWISSYSIHHYQITLRKGLPHMSKCGHWVESYYCSHTYHMWSDIFMASWWPIILHIIQLASPILYLPIDTIPMAMTENDRKPVERLLGICSKLQICTPRCILVSLQTLCVIRTVYALS